MKTVTIAIPALRRPDLTARCLEFIQKQTLTAAEWEVIVIENEAQPGTILPDPLPPNTSRIELPNNEGTTGSINRAVEASNSRYILLLNNDIELDPDYLQKLVDKLDRDPRLGFAIGKLLRATQRTHLDGAGDAMLMAGAAYRVGHLEPDEGQFDRCRPLLTACAAAALYRREAYAAAGGLDLDFFAYVDDADLALRASLLGYSGVYLPEAVAYHIGSATTGEMQPHTVEYITRNQIFLLFKDYPRPVLRRLLSRIIVYQVLWMMFALRRGNVRAYFRGLRSGLAGRQRMREKRREVLAHRRLDDDDFLARLRESERQIYDWQQSLPHEQRSTLLEAYFRFFGRPELRNAPTR